jgi:hypothetical protein
MDKFYYWGPLLYNTKIKKEDITKIKNLCIKDNKKDLRKDLAGHIKQEYSIDKDKIVEIEHLGRKTVYGIQTTTGNYIADGYASKNCDTTIRARLAGFVSLNEKMQKVMSPPITMVQMGY